VQGRGQGYRVTAAGAAALQKGRIAPAPPPAEEKTAVRETTWERGETVRNALLDPSPPVVALVLLFANLAVFAVGIGLAWQRGIPLDDYLMGRGLGVAQLLTDLGAVLPHAVIGLGEYWRLLTHLFLHSGLLHIALNSMALFVLGPRLESLWGAKRFLALYLISGWVGGCAVLLTGRGAVGASGAICGLFGSLATWLWLNREHLPEELRAAWQRMIGTNLILLVIISMMPRVSWEAHLGGAIGGVLVSIPLHYVAIGSLPGRLIALLGIVAVPAIALAVALTPSQWPMLTARWRFNEPVIAMDAWIAEQQEKFIHPALAVEPPAWANDADFLGEARAAAAEAQSKLAELIEQLKNAIPEDNEPLRQEAVQTAAYFDACRKMFQALERLADRPEIWEPRRLELVRRYRAAMQYRRALENQRFMPVLPPREPPQEAPPAPIDRDMAQAVSSSFADYRTFRQPWRPRFSVTGSVNDLNFVR
jgi:rhomboid protease GluP